MKDISQLFLAALPWLLLLLFNKGFCVQRVDCQWGAFGDWSECDGCTKLQTRSRAMAVFAQFGGNLCSGGRTETRPCETMKGCPLEDGCGDRFRCGSGKCISRSLMCNGDVDCEEDGLDEQVCEIKKYIMCLRTDPPPNSNVLGLGFDAATGAWRASVINMQSFGGLCRAVLSGDRSVFYRLPFSTVEYSSVVPVQNDFSGEEYTSKWHYAKDTVQRGTVTGTTTGYRNYDFHQTEDGTQTRKLVVLKNDVEVAHFQSNAPQYILISEEFWKALAKLPSVYDYAAYRTVLERFGTHYMSEGSLGGHFSVIASVDAESEQQTVSESLQYKECEKTKGWILFIPITRVNCQSDHNTRSSSSPSSRASEVNKVEVVGGGIEYIAALQRLRLNDQQKNWEMYSNWADSVRSNPVVIKKKLRPLSELVKEVQCAGVKRLYLRRAIEQYLSESDPCNCRPCRNNGLAVMDGYQCKCICKPGTSGQACEVGTEEESQQGIIHGSWACWSAWSSCSGGRQSRSRSCSNPSPQNGGQHCTGETTETSDCEDQALQHLRTMEPQCFDFTLPASQKCGVPPALVNGYILDPKDVYLVGSRVEYTCDNGFYLIGRSIQECTADLTWSPGLGVCTNWRCTLESLAEDVITDSSRTNFYLGDTVSLSCPAGKQLIGEERIICTSSRNFSPDPADIRCIQMQQAQMQQRVSRSVECEPWEKSVRGKCVCKTPFECRSSLELCATNPRSGKSVLLNVCKMHVLQCMGKNNTIAEDSVCVWPDRTTAGCTRCHMWETCDDEINECRCKDSAQCMSSDFNVCVRVGEDDTAAAQTMNECEAGLRRCKGEKVSVISILPCDA